MLDLFRKQETLTSNKSETVNLGKEKKHKNNKKVRMRFAVTNSYLIRFVSANA